MSELVYEKAEGIACITLNRPEKRNALTPRMIVELAAAWSDFASDRDLRVAILSGAGDKAFSAGADLGRLIPLLSGARAAEDEWDRRLLDEPDLLHRALLRRIRLFKPVIAAVNGFALAGGTEILQGTDLRLATPDATFGLSEVQRGVVPGGGSLVKLARQIPYAKAMQILLTGEPITAHEALAVGLINEIVPAAGLRARAAELARRIADNAPLAVQACKEVVARTNGMALDEAFAIEDECAQRILRTADAVEGPRAFLEKRQPVFAGR